MHYFKRNIGDYHKKAGRLNMLQHGAYTLLMDACYDRERFPTREEAIDWCWASSEAEIAAVDLILSKFFELHEGVYKQDRIAEEVEQYHANAATNARIAQEREAKKKEQKARSVNDASTVSHEPPPNHKPLTINQEPITINKDINTLPAKAVSVVKQSNGLALLSEIDNLPEQVAEDFLKVRKAKRSPLTATALALIEREAVKAGLTTAQAIAIAAARGWQSFKADWIADNDGKTTAERTQDFRDRQAEKAYAPLLHADKETLRAWGLDK